jgi:putative ABC transport system permease protein
MSNWRRLIGWLSGRADRDLDRELRVHLELEAEEQQETGLPAAEACYGARRAFGNLTSVKEDVRAMWGWTSLDRIRQDLGFGWRLLWKNPAVTLIALGALALGIGATTAIFTVVNAVLLRPLPFPEPDRLVMVREINPLGNPNPSVQTQNFLDWRERSHSFENLAAVHQIPMNLGGEGEPEQLTGLRVSAELFDVFGVPPLLGRGILPEEDVAQASGSVVLSHGLWMSRFGGEPAALGTKVVVNGNPLQVVGVMPPGFTLAHFRAELFVPVQIDPAGAPNDGRNYSVFARLREGVTLEQANEEMKRIATQTAAERPGMNAKWSAAVTPLKEETVGQVRPALLVLLGAAAFVLLLACANVANLLLMRAAVRRREITVRLALGAGRGRLIHQLLIESLLLASLGGLAGFALAYAGVRAILSMLTSSIPLPRASEIQVDGAILAFSLAVSLGAGILFGMAPAFQAARQRLAEGLQQGGRAAAGGGNRVRNTLVVAEVSLALLLACGAGLMLRSFAALNRVDPGFRSENVLTLQMLLLPSKYFGDLNRRAGFVNEVLDRIRRLPGVTAASSIHFLPLGGVQSGTGYFRTDRPEPQPGEHTGGEVSVVSRGYFQTMGIPLLAGRVFDERDAIGTPQVAILNQTAAKALFPGESPLGKRLRIGWNGDPEAEIIGVVGDSRSAAISTSPQNGLFLPNEQRPHVFCTLVVRTAGDPLDLAAPVKQQIHGVDPDQGVARIDAMEAFVADSIARPRLQTALLAAFGLIALLLACVGIYGVISYNVAQQTREIGIRLALGANSGRILRNVVRGGLGLSLAGIAVGVGAAMLLTRYLEGLLYGVRPTDPGVFAAVVAVLLLVAAAACYFPARRAAGVDPMIALREE